MNELNRRGKFSLLRRAFSAALAIIFVMAVFHIRINYVGLESSPITAAASAADYISKSFTPTAQGLEYISKELVVNKGSLSEEKKKISTDLLKLVDSRFVPEGKSSQELKNNMMVNNQYTTSIADEISGIGERVYVYVFLKPEADIFVADAYLAEVTDRDAENGIVVAWIEVSKLLDLASNNNVNSIRTVIHPKVYAGSVTTEGVVKENVDKVLNKFNQNGTGMKIGVISDGVDGMSTAIASGDLPSNVTVLSNSANAGNQSEGVAMLEIIYDMAPGASLYFHDCGDNKVAFNIAIDNLVAAGCNIIVDDIGWISEPFFEDGIIATHLTNILANNNIIYISSAGNQADSHYQGEFAAYSSTNSLHKYPLYVKIQPGENVIIILQWNDKFGSSYNDYDLLLFNDDTGDLIDQSTSTQSGAGSDPLEVISYTNNTSSTITGAILADNYNASTKTLEMFVYGGSLYSNNITGADSIYGHPAVPGVLAVGSVDLTSSSQIRYYSSLGPTTITYPSSSSRKKPDLCGVDGVAVTGAGGFPNKFYGTSAAAPHVAAIAALLWAEFPTKTGNQIRDLLKNNAKDLGSSGFDTIYGYGISDAMKVFMATMADNCFTKSVSKTGGALVSINSSGNAANEVWLAPSGTTTFVQGTTMTKVAGNSTVINAPTKAGAYKLYLLVDGVASSPSTSTLTVTTTVAPVSASSSNPINNATGVLNSIVPSITFNQNILSSADYSNITLMAGSTNIPFTPSISGSTLYLTPSSLLQEGTKYTVVVPANAIKNANGIIQATDYTFSFTISMPISYTAIAPPYNTTTSWISTDGLAANGNYAKGYSFSGIQGQTVVVDLSSSVDCYLYLLNSSKMQLTTNDNAYSTTTNSKIVYTLPYTGQYFILASESSKATGSYAIDVKLINGQYVSIDNLILANNSGIQLSSLSLGQTVYITSNISANVTGAKVVFAVYNNGKLLTVKSLDYSSKGAYNTSFVLPEMFGDLSCKVFVLNDFVSLKSLTTHKHLQFNTYDITPQAFPESAHSYANNYDNTWTYAFPASCKSLNITFASETKTESGYDYIYVMDKDENNIQSSPFTGTTLAGKTVTVPGNAFKIKLTSDGSNTAYGFRITSITPVY